MGAVSRGLTVRQLSLLFGWDAPATFLDNTEGINASLAFMRSCGQQQVSDLSAFSCKLAAMIHYCSSLLARPPH